MSKKVPMVSVPAYKLVVVTENHGGYTGGRCVVCGERGWLCEKPYGLPYGSKDPASSFHHKRECPMNAALTDSGELAG